MMDEPIIKFGKALKKIDSLEEELTMYKKTVGESSDAIISLEKEKDGYRKSAFELQKEVFRLCGVSKEKEELQTRLSTLLKASEGMEKALEKIATYGYSDAPELEQDQHQIAQAALADFRAVKEEK
jgi:chromosome segregation ATPase